MADFLLSDIADLNVKLGKDATKQFFKDSAQWSQHITAFVGDKTMKHFYKGNIKVNFKKC